MFQEDTNASYGKQGWYKSSFLHQTQPWYERPKNLNWLPLTGIWLTQKPNEGNVHCDRNVVGATLCWLQATLQVPRFVYRRLQENWQNTISNLGIIGGSWASYSHCNLKVDNHPGNSRTSWLSTLTLVYFQSDTSVFIMYPSFNSIIESGIHYSLRLFPKHRNRPLLTPTPNIVPTCPSRIKC
jgi:hypothetical protein